MSIYISTTYLQELSNLTLCIMETINLSYVYADRDGCDECMRAGSLKNSLPARLYIYMYYISTTLFIIIFQFNPLYAENPNLCAGEQRRLWRICA